MNLRLVLLVAMSVSWLGSGCSKKCKPGEDVDCWITALKDPLKIDLAIDNLKQIGDKKAEPALIETIKSQSLKPQQIEQLAEIFQKWNTTAAVKPMLSAIDFTIGPNKESSKAKRTNRANQKIASALGDIRDQQAVVPLIRLLNTTKEPGVQRAVARSLGQLKAQEATDDLIRLSSDSKVNAIVRMNAVYALGEIANPKAVDSLILSLYRDNAYFFFQAGLALVKIGQAAVEPLVLTMLGKNAAAAKLALENTQGVRGAMESNAAKVLGDIQDPTALQPLLDLAEKVSKWKNKTEKMLVMTRVINALGSLQDPKAIEVISKYLPEDLWDVRTVCASAINSIGHRPAVDLLFQFATKAKHPQTSLPLVEAMGNLGTHEIISKLDELRASQQDTTLTSTIQTSMLKAKAHQSCMENPDCWIQKLNDPNPALREKAAYELGRIGDKKAVQPLIQSIADESENVRFAIMWALNKLQAKEAIEPIEKLVQSEKGSTRYKVANYNYQLLAARLSRTK